MTPNPIAGFPRNHRSESRRRQPCGYARSLTRAPNINFNLHKCIIINSIVAPADVRDVVESEILQHSEKFLRTTAVRISFFPSFSNEKDKACCTVRQNNRFINNRYNDAFSQSGK